MISHSSSLRIVREDTRRRRRIFWMAGDQRIVPVLNYLLADTVPTVPILSPCEPMMAGQGSDWALAEVEPSNLA